MQRGGNNLTHQGPRTPSSLGPDGGPPPGMHPSQQQHMHMQQQQQQQQMDGRFPGGGPAGPGGSPFGAGGLGPKMGGGVNFMDMNSPNGKSGDGVSITEFHLIFCPKTWWTVFTERYHFERAPF